jgi:drug/metabolite transporter (DMT)-like permease
MDQKTFSIVAGVIFAAVALFHLVRIYMDWPVMIGGWSVLSWIGLVVASGLAFFGLKLAERDARRNE